jgi:hypothetical protein
LCHVQGHGAVAQPASNTRLKAIAAQVTRVLPRRWKRRLPMLLTDHVENTHTIGGGF